MTPTEKLLVKFMMEFVMPAIPPTARTIRLTNGMLIKLDDKTATVIDGKHSVTIPR